MFDKKKNNKQIGGATKDLQAILAAISNKGTAEYKNAIKLLNETNELEIQPNKGVKHTDTVAARKKSNEAIQALLNKLLPNEKSNIDTIFDNNSNLTMKETAEKQIIIALSLQSASVPPSAPLPVSPPQLPTISENVITATENKKKITALIANAQKIVDDMSTNPDNYTINGTNRETFNPNTDPLVLTLTLTNKPYNREDMLKLVQAYVDKAIALVIETSQLLEAPQVGGRRKSRKAKK